jgi:lipopolysaccharide/colanic/teichoic acid biosynthesis glycosyltransferase
MISAQAKGARWDPSVGGNTAYRSAKRLIDVMASAIGLLLLLPIFAVIAVAIKWYSPGPVLYGSMRIGRGRKPFRMWKFRTMVPGADRLGGSITTAWDPRVTPIGRVLRHSKLDELPSLWNVLAGEMTLVGPRPETPAWVKHYTPEMAQVLETRPGVTDVTQILFRHEEQMLKSAVVDEGQYMAVMRWKVALQLEYLRRCSLASDVKVLSHTILAIFDRAPDAELDQLVARAAVYESGSLPQLLRQRAERIWGPNDRGGVPYSRKSTLSA